MSHGKGFTLIELMIAIAIIGILATGALVSYQSFIAKARVAEVISVITGTKTLVSECLLASMEGTINCSDAEIGVDTDEISGITIFISSLSIENSGVILIAPNWQNIANIESSSTLTFIPMQTSGGVSWTCSSNSDDIKKYLPANCR